ncbi:MAG: hypothetical protein Q9220_003242 [cf. Caloplaca sp. 1 TL-2023]
MSSFKAAYQSYLASPNASAFAVDGSINYITTLTTVHKVDAIAKHLEIQQRSLKKRNEKLLSAIEGDHSLCLEVETTLEFLTGGGTYLPGLDDNFLIDQVVTFPVIHIVQYGSNGNIEQLRLFWDQGSLLKQVEVIGSRGKNWPIRDGKDHIKLIASSVAAVSSSSTGTSGLPMRNGKRDPNEVIITSKPAEPKDNATPARRGTAAPPPRDYNELFAGDGASPPRAQQKSASPKKHARPGSKDQSSKPPPRDYHDLFVGDDNDRSPSSRARSVSPHKENTAIAKAGAGKNFQPMRLFEDIAEQPATPGASSPEKSRKHHPTTYNHFEFGDGPTAADTQPLPARPKTNKHQSQWGFEDFSSPEKKRVPQKASRSQDVRHFGWGDDENIHESPAKHPNVPHPRPDAKPHFELQDNNGSTPKEKRAPGPSHGGANERGAGLYKDNVFNEESASPEKKAHPLATVTNLPNGGAKGKENQGIKTGGDGMGGRKGAVRSWGFGDTSDGEDGDEMKGRGGFRPERKQLGRKQEEGGWAY